MLTYEDALYHKMLLEAGVRGELAPVIERLLAEEDPLSDVAADLAFAGNDANRQISALNKYLSNKDEADINMDAVHEKLIAYFRSIPVLSYIMTFFTATRIFKTAHRHIYAA